MFVNHQLFADDKYVLGHNQCFQRLLNTGCDNAAKHEIVFNRKKTTSVVPPPLKALNSPQHQWFPSMA